MESFDHEACLRNFFFQEIAVVQVQMLESEKVTSDGLKLRAP